MVLLFFSYPAGSGGIVKIPGHPFLFYFFRVAAVVLFFNVRGDVEENL
jgi:hypothetical protein